MAWRYTPSPKIVVNIFHCIWATIINTEFSQAIFLYVPVFLRILFILKSPTLPDTKPMRLGPNQEMLFFLPFWNRITLRWYWTNTFLLPIRPQSILLSGKLRWISYQVQAKIPPFSANTLWLVLLVNHAVFRKTDIRVHFTNMV